MKRSTDGVRDSTDAIMKYVVPRWKIVGEKKKDMNISRFLNDSGVGPYLEN